MTSKPPVLLHVDDPEPAIEIVRRTHPDLSVTSCVTYEGLSEAVAASGAEVVYSIRFAGTPGFPRAALVESETVRWVSVGGSGTDHLGSWDTNRVAVTNAAGVAADAMAEYALGAMLHFSLGLERFRQAQKRHEWLSGARVKPIEGRTVVIVGLGHTGMAAARRFKAMGMTVIALRARPAPSEHVDEVHGIDALLDVLPRADFVLVCVPLLASTRGLLGQAAFTAMKPGVMLVDVSRGRVIEERALMAALDDGRVAGAALDVFAEEPLPKDHRLWDYENVLITPHCSSVYDGWELKSVAMFAENLTRYRSGDPLTNVVDPTRGY